MSLLERLRSTLEFGARLRERLVRLRRAFRELPVGVLALRPKRRGERLFPPELVAERREGRRVRVSRRLELERRDSKRLANRLRRLLAPRPLLRELAPKSLVLARLRLRRRLIRLLDARFERLSERHRLCRLALGGGDGRRRLRTFRRRAVALSLRGEPSLERLRRGSRAPPRVLLRLRPRLERVRPRLLRLLRLRLRRVRALGRANPLLFALLRRAFRVATSRLLVRRLLLSLRERPPRQLQIARRSREPSGRRRGVFALRFR